MTLTDRVRGDLPRGRVTLELDEIQATVLRYRPEPYYGTHDMLHRRCRRRRAPWPIAEGTTLRQRDPPGVR